jgi:protein TonB
MSSRLSTTVYSVCVAVSLLLHAGSLTTLADAARQRAAHEKHAPVQVRIVEAKKEEPAPVPPPAPTPAPTPPPPTPRPKNTPPPKKKEAVSESKPQTPPQEQQKPIQGLDANSFDKSGNAKFSAPMGNTRMAPDTGERVNAQPGAITADLSAPPAVIKSTVPVPQYTEDAIDAAFEGVFEVDVYVDATGKVTSVELRKKVGYGMDARIEEAARAARFTPQKNRLGQPEAGWGSLTFNLVIP